MSHSRRLRFVWMTAAVIALWPTQSAVARRTVIDGGATMVTQGYCSPNSANTPGCSPYAMPFSIQIAGNSYNSFWVNSNGTVSFQSIESFLGPQNSDTPPPPQTLLSDYGSIPIFSPAFADGQGFLPLDPSEGYDGNYVARTSVGANGFTVNWFACDDPLSCGLNTIDLITNATFDQTSFDSSGLSFIIALSSQLNDPTATDQENFDSGRLFLLSSYPNTLPVYTMTLTGLPNGFQVDYSYNPAATGHTGNFGYNFTGGGFEAIAPFHDQSFVFASTTPSVPEPSTWMSLLLGLGLVGVALRRKRRTAAPA